MSDQNASRPLPPPPPPNTALTSDWVFNEFRLYLFVNTLKALKEVYDP